MREMEQPVATPAVVTPDFAAELPSPVTTILRAEGVRPADLTLVVSSNLAPDGQFGEQWLLSDLQNLWVIERRNGTANLRHKFPPDKIEDARGERCVGNGLMQVTVDRQPHVLLHYSNELTNRFGRVVQYLHARTEYGTDVPVPDPTADSHRCLVCGRILVDTSSKVCPNCIQRGKLFRRLMELARPYWSKMGLIVILLVAGAWWICYLPT